MSVLTACCAAQSVKISILLFYTYVEPLWSAVQQQAAIDLSIKKVCIYTHMLTT
jgi:hypothetical protein